MDDLLLVATLEIFSRHKMCKNESGDGGGSKSRPNMTIFKENIWWNSYSSCKIATSFLCSLVQKSCLATDLHPTWKWKVKKKIILRVAQTHKIPTIATTHKYLSQFVWPCPNIQVTINHHLEKLWLNLATCSFISK